MVFNMVDGIVLVVVLAFVMWSAMNGAAREIVSLLGLLGGILAANWGQATVAGWMAPIVGDADLARILASVGLIVGGLLAGTLLGGFVETLTRQQPGGLSRLVAAVAGFTKGVAMAMVLAWAINGHLPGLQDDLADSFSGPLLTTLLIQLNNLPVI